MIYERPDEQVFALEAKSGEVVDFPDVLRGWGLTFEQTGGIPPMEWFNALGLRTDKAIQYFLQNGIAEWGAQTDYPTSAYVRYNNKVWRAKKQGLGNEPSQQSDYWEQAALTLEEVKALIPQLMTIEELNEGTSTTPRTVNANLLNSIAQKSQYIFKNINSNSILTANDAGVVLIDSSTGDITLTLPDTNLNISFILMRIDNSINKVKVQRTGTNKIKYNLSANQSGYDFFYLFGAGDYWHVVSDGQGGWHEVNRKDKEAIGANKFIASLTPPVGGYLMANGSELSRSDYPFLWDYAQKSGMIVNDADFLGNDGCFTRGNGSTTFRIPDLRGLFLRSLDAGRGVDINRRAGSWQRGSVNAADPSQTTSLVMGLYNTAGDDLEDFWFRAGYDRSGIDIYNTMSGMSVLANQQHSYNTTLGITRPVNAALPIYIKII